MFSHVFTCVHMFSHVFTALDQCSNIKWKIMTETDNIFIAGLLKTEIPQCQARLLEGHQRSRWPIKRVPHVKVRNIHHAINIIQQYIDIYIIYLLPKVWNVSNNKHIVAISPSMAMAMN